MPWEYGTNALPQPLPPDLNTARLPDAMGWHLRAYCAACREARCVAVRIIIDWHRRLPSSLGAAVHRLRCRTCKAAPGRVELVDYPDRPDCQVIEVTRLAGR